MTLTPWQPISSRTLLELPPWFSVVEDTVRLPGGRTIENYYRIEAPDSVLIHAVLPDGKVMLERQYKHCLGRVVLTCPAGGVEAGEAPLEAAKRELLEETGYEGVTWHYLGGFKVDGTRGISRAHLFHTEGLRQVSRPCHGDMEEMELAFLGPDEILRAFQSQEIALLPDLAILAISCSDLLRGLFQKCPS